MSFNDFFGKVSNCSLCEEPSKDAIPLYKVKHLEWYIEMLKCQRCGLTYKSHIPTDQYFKEIYGKSYNHYSISNVEWEVSALQHRFKRIGRANGKLLDYGCGNGSFVLAALRNGWDSYGCDPFLPELLAAPILNNRCYKADFSRKSTLDLERFNCITMWATAEHLVDSRNTFLNLFSVLEKKGLFVFNSPFGDSKIAKLDGANWHMANIVEHLQFHTIESVRYLASLGGLSIKSVRICGSPYPFGKTVIDHSVLSSDTETFTIMKKHKKSLAKGFLEYLLTDVFSKNKFRTKDFVLAIMNIMKNGDHLEIILEKE